MRHVVYKIWKEQSLVLKLWSGTISREELMQYERAPFLDPDVPATPLNGLCDITTADFSSLTPSDLAEVACIFSDHSCQMKGSKIAIVASGQFAKAREFENAVTGAGVDVIAFTDLSIACTWLGVPFAETAKWFAWARAELAVGQ
jgi:hypothetical protein